MDFHDTLSTLLPPPRDDDPVGVRQDILDELGDHLACAYNRELMRGVDSSLARQRVLERFGDPAAMARRLWLDAMKGKIVAKRVLIATCVVVMVACATSVALAWQWMNQDRLLRNRAVAEAIDANRRMSEALAQSQATNQEMLKQMREMTRAVTHPVSPDWNPVTFKLTEETADGPPAAGFSLTLTRSAGNTTRTGRGEVRTLRDDLLALSPTNSATPTALGSARGAHRPGLHRPVRRHGRWRNGRWRNGHDCGNGPGHPSDIGFFGRRRLWSGPAGRLQVSNHQELGYWPVHYCRRAQRRTGKQSPQVDHMSQDAAGTAAGANPMFLARGSRKGATGTLRAFRFPVSKARPRSGMGPERYVVVSVAETTIESRAKDRPVASARHSFCLVWPG